MLYCGYICVHKHTHIHTSVVDLCFIGGEEQLTILTAATWQSF